MRSYDDVLAEIGCTCPKHVQVYAFRGLPTQCATYACSWQRSNISQRVNKIGRKERTRRRRNKIYNTQNEG